jgi:hypothetical protein
LEAPPDFKARELVLVFERQADFSPLANKKVLIQISSPAKLLLPPDGIGKTDAQGALKVSYVPAALYDESAARSGDLIIDYPAALYVKMDLSGYEFEWQVDDSQSFASYADPLYQGLDRKPDEGPAYINLFLP